MLTFSKGVTHKTIDEVNPHWNLDDVPDRTERIVYAHDVWGNPITPPDGYEIITEHCEIEKDFIHFDMYGGWIEDHNYEWHTSRGHHICRGMGGYSDAMGRWICWARKIDITK